MAVFSLNFLQVYITVEKNFSFVHAPTYIPESISGMKQSNPWFESLPSPLGE